MDGLWTVEFGSSVGSFGGGVVVMRGGMLLGGDSSYYYSGTYDVTGNTFKALVAVKPFIPNSSSVFNTMGQNLSLKLLGQLIDENHAVAQGSPKGMQDHVIGLKLTKRA